MSAVKSDLRSLVTAEGAMILDVAADELTTLNATGGYVWARLREGETIDQIVRDLAADTGEETAVIAADVQEFVKELVMTNLFSR